MSMRLWQLSVVLYHLHHRVYLTKSSFPLHNFTFKKCERWETPLLPHHFVIQAKNHWNWSPQEYSGSEWLTESNPNPSRKSTPLHSCSSHTANFISPTFFWTLRRSVSIARKASWVALEYDVISSCSYAFIQKYIYFYFSHAGHCERNRDIKTNKTTWMHLENITPS